MQKINSKKIVDIIGSNSQVIDVDIETVETDSRKIKAGDLFIAVRGEKFDGHKFVENVINAGAALVIVEEIIPNVPLNKQILVDNTLKAYGLIGAYNRSLYKGIVIGLTGSAGKTTTKEEIKFALSMFGSVYATSGNFNNHIGVPKTLIDLDMDSDFAVVEMGMSAKGEILALTSFANPDIAIITNVYPMHIEFFNCFEEIAYAKAEIFEGLKENGIAIINKDANFAHILISEAKKSNAKVFEFNKDCNLDVDLELSEIGEHHYYNACCVLKLVEVLGLDVKKVAKELKNFGALDGRGKKHSLNGTDFEYSLIDDSYSGQPDSMKIAINVLDKAVCSGRKIAVLGKMAELGKCSKQCHVEVGQLLSKTNVDIVIGVCEEMKDMLKELPLSVEQYYFDNKDGIDDFLLNKLLQNNDIVLIKGSRYSSKLYQVAESLIIKGAKK